MNAQEAGQKGGLTTLERYGREHFARITNGRKRRPRHGKETLAGRSSRIVVARHITTTGAKGGTANEYGAGGEHHGAFTDLAARSHPNVIQFKPRADRESRPPIEGKVIPFGR